MEVEIEGGSRSGNRSKDHCVELPQRLSLPDVSRENIQSANESVSPTAHQLVSEQTSDRLRLEAAATSPARPSLPTTDTAEEPLSAPQARGQSDRLQRCFDFVMALLLGLAILPLVIAICTGIRLDSAGPVVYGRIRVGKNGRCFRCLKFRSMHQDADARLAHLLETDQELRRQYRCHHKLRHDARITRVGKILRRYSLDELPQLWNVLKGDMSIIGPRPYDPGEIPAMEGKEHIIQMARPGLTGLWQVSGRANTSFCERVAMDAYYVSNRSISLNLWILMRTVLAVLSGDGAY